METVAFIVYSSDKSGSICPALAKTLLMASVVSKLDTSQGPSKTEPYDDRDDEFGTVIKTH
jgi:hypothetical protein